MEIEQNLEIEYYPTESTMRLPFSAAVRVGKMLYLSGQIGMDATGNIVSGGIAAETRQTMENIPPRWSNMAHHWIGSSKSPS